MKRPIAKPSTLSTQEWNMYTEKNKVYILWIWNSTYNISIDHIRILAPFVLVTPFSSYVFSSLYMNRKIVKLAIDMSVLEYEWPEMSKSSSLSPKISKRLM